MEGEDEGIDPPEVVTVALVLLEDFGIDRQLGGQGRRLIAVNHGSVAREPSFVVRLYFVRQILAPTLGSGSVMIGKLISPKVPSGESDVGGATATTFT